MQSGFAQYAQDEEQFKQLQQQLSTVLKQANKRMATKMSSLQKQMGSSEQCEALQKQADMLMANVYRCCHPVSTVVISGPFFFQVYCILCIPTAMSSIGAARGKCSQVLTFFLHSEWSLLLLPYLT